MSAVRIVISVSALTIVGVPSETDAVISYLVIDRSPFRVNIACVLQIPSPNDDPSPALLIPSLLLALLVTYKQNDRSSIYLAVEKRLRESLEL
jgi:hypothetical protein